MKWNWRHASFCYRVMKSRRMIKVLDPKESEGHGLCLKMCVTAALKFPIKISNATNIKWNLNWTVCGWWVFVQGELLPLHCDLISEMLKHDNVYLFAVDGITAFVGQNTNCFRCVLKDVISAGNTLLHSFSSSALMHVAFCAFLLQ